MARSNNTTTLALIGQKVIQIEEDVKEVKRKLDSNYATKEWVEAEYGQTKRTLNALLIAFGLAIVSAFAAFVVRGGLK